MSGVEILYKCVLCPKAFSNVQSLRAHMKVHRDVEFEQLNVRLPKAKVEEFRGFCRKHNTTTCHMVLAMIDAYVEGDKKGLIVLNSSNPAIVHLQQFFASRPRGHGKYDYGKMELGADEVQRPQCFICGSVAVARAHTTGWRDVFLCRKHLHYQNEFECWQRV